jgi:integrase
MAWLELARSGVYHVCLRVGKQRFCRSLKTGDEQEADFALARVEENLRLIERARLQVPDDADFMSFLLSDGHASGRFSAPPKLSLNELFAKYIDAVSQGSLEESTIATIHVHRRWFAKHFRSREVSTIDFAALQGYVNWREKQQGIRGLVSPATIRKEIATLKTAWRWAQRRKLVQNNFPDVSQLDYKKGQEKLPYMQFTDVLKRTKGLAPKEAAQLWECVFLSPGELKELLAYVKRTARHPFIYPMFLFCAHTGARRSEIARAMTHDVNLREGFILLRERKRDSTKITVRIVPLSPLLKQVLRAWLRRVPEGNLFVHEGRPLTRKAMWHHFGYALKDSKWENLRGFHTLRHGYISALAEAGTPQAIIDELVSHSCEQQRRRYRHLTPRGTQKFIAAVFG